MGSFLESHLLILIFLSLIKISALASVLTIYENPQDWTVDVSNYDIDGSFASSTKDVKFTCRATGEPPIEYQWFQILRKNGPELQIVNNSREVTVADGVLNLKVNRSSFDKNFTEKVFLCKASNRVGTIVSRPAHLRVVIDSSREILTRTSDIPFPVYTCSNPPHDTRTESATGGSVSVYTGGSDYRYDFYVYENNTRRLYKIDGNSTKYGKTFFVKGPFLVVQDTPTERTRSRIVSSLKHPQTLDVLCNKSWVMDPLIKTESKVLHKEIDINGLTLNLSASSPSLFKRGRFTVQPPGDAKVRLHVLFLDRTQADNRRYQIGDNLELLCVAASRYKVQVTWSFPSHSSSIAVTSRPMGSHLLITNLQSADAGKYTCRATGRGSWGASLSLNIEPHEPPTFVPARSTPPTTEVPEGGRASFRCNFRAAGHRLVSWFLNGREMFPTVERTQSVLVIPSVDAALHSGPVQCLVGVDDDGAGLFVPRSRSRNSDPAPMAILGGDFVAQTVAVLLVRPDNRHAPSVELRHGPSLTLAVPAATADLIVTPVFVADKDRGAGGRIANCSVSCRPRAPCPVLWWRLPMRLVLQLDGDASIPASVAVAVNCSDQGSPPRHTVARLTLRLCRAGDRGCRTTARAESAPGKALQKLPSLGLDVGSPTDARQLLEALANISADAAAFSAFDLRLVQARTDDLLNFYAARPALLPAALPGLARLLGNTLSAPPAALRGPGASRALGDVDRMAEMLQATPEGVAVASRALAVGAVAVPERPGEEFLGFEAAPGEARVVVGGGSGGGGNGSGRAWARVAVRAQQVAADRVDFTMIADASVFAALAPEGSAATVLSPVIAARTALRPDAAGAVRLTFSAPHGVRTRCAFWNFSLGAWDGAGCRQVSADGGRADCECSHLTHFALLLAVERNTTSAREHDAVLRVLSLFALSCSSLALAATILVYARFLYILPHVARPVHRSAEQLATSSRILVSLCAALLSGHVVFLGGSGLQTPGAGCKVVAVLLHFCYLAAFAWSLVEGVHIFVSLIIVSFRRSRAEPHISRFFLKASVGGWGAPLSVVCLTLVFGGVDSYGLVLANSGTKVEGLCFLKDKPFYFAFLAPMLVTLLVNGVVMVLLYCVLIRYNRSQFHDTSVSLRQRLVGFVGVCLLLNVTWIFGALQVKIIRIIFMYLFVVFNGFQGVLIFAFYCLVRTEVRNQVICKLICHNDCHRIKRMYEGASNGSGTTTTTAASRPSDGSLEINLARRSTLANTVDEVPTVERRVSAVENRQGDREVEVIESYHF